MSAGEDITFSLLLKKALTDNHLTLNPLQLKQCCDYLRLLQTWNRVFNLTAITEPRAQVYLHIIDSLIIHPFLNGNQLIDMGSGAGLPGIPLAIFNPDKNWVLLDKSSKKTRFLTQVTALLGLKNVAVVQNHCEKFKPYGSGFDTIVSRAFGTLQRFVETGKHLLAQQGVMVAMKGKYPLEELAAIPQDFMAKAVNRLAITGSEMERHVVCLMKKIERT